MKRTFILLMAIAVVACTDTPDEQIVAQEFRLQLCGQAKIERINAAYSAPEIDYIYAVRAEVDRECNASLRAQMASQRYVCEARGDVTRCGKVFEDGSLAQIVLSHGVATFKKQANR